MRNLLFEFCSWFIPGKVARHEFRRRHIRSPWRKFEERLARRIELATIRSLCTMTTHQRTFTPFKNRYCGRDVVVVAGGPSASSFTLIPDAVYIGVNRAYKMSSIAFDYLFWQDYAAVRDRKTLDELKAYKGHDCVKFYGLIGYDAWDNNLTIPESYALEAGALRYYAKQGDLDDFAYDLSVQPLVDYGTVVFSALQFALWTNPRRIYLVGCDCSHAGYFYGAKGASNDLELDRVMRGYADFKRFASRYYPETEIVSVNPVGLRGMFVDEFVNGHE